MLQQMKKRNKKKLLPIMGEMEKILSSLANEDALKIFIEAEEGIESSAKAIKKLNLTQKRYYVWLKRLIEAGLIEKRGSAYVQTMLGKLCYKMGEALLNAVNQRDQLELADKLMRSDMLSIKEKEDILSAISKKELLGTASLDDIIHEVKMITYYDDYIDKIIELLDNAKESAYIAAHRIDARCAESIVGVVERGVKFFYLSSEERQLSERIQALKVILNPASVKMMYNLYTSRDVNMRVSKLSYSFVVVDGEYGLIEIPHPAYHSARKREFYVAFEFKNILFSQSLVEAFVALYEKGKTHPLLKFAEKYFRLYK